MKTNSTIFLTTAISALCFASVQGHGHMTSPAIRPITTKYRADCLFGLKGAGDGELQLAPLENLSSRGQADQPAAPTFEMMNGCRGTVYEAGGPLTTVTPGGELPVKWVIQAPHPGYMELYIVKAKTDAGGKIIYEQQGSALKRIENFGTNGGQGSTTVTLPASLPGCGTAGNCALQFYWHSAQASQTYASCADIVVGGSSANTTPTITTAAPAAATDAPENEYEEPTAAPATTAPKKSCTKRMRRNRQ